MSGVNHTSSHKPQKPAQPKPQPKPREEDDGLFRDEQSSEDGWRKKDGPGSTGGYGIRSAPSDGVLRPASAPPPQDSSADALFTDKVDIKFPKK